MKSFISYISYNLDTIGMIVMSTIYALCFLFAILVFVFATSTYRLTPDSTPWENPFCIESFK